MSVEAGLLNEVMENIIQGVVMFDSDRNLMVWNRPYQEILQFPDGFLRPGLSNHEMALHLARRGEFGPGDPKRLTEKRLAEIWGAGETRTGITINGEFIYEVLCKRTGDGGLVITYTDVTERERTRASLAALNEHKDKFFMLIAHDLRSPFNALLGYSEVLQDRAGDLEPHRIREYSAMIHRSAEEAHKLLEDLLDWSRLQLGGYQLSIRPLDLAPLVRRNAGRFQPLASIKGINLTVSDMGPIPVMADSGLVETILRNLISNAIKFSHQESRVTLEAVQEADLAGFTVRDEGVGIPLERVRELFSFGADHITRGTRGEPGTGLGLHLCKEMVDLQKGEIRVDSAIGEGTAITVLLPVSSS